MNMKSLYLILAATAVVAAPKPQTRNNDVIWYPVEDEDGVFVSIYGEKYRMPKESKYRSHRRARYSGTEPIWSYDPAENQDSSFFHNIHERRPLAHLSFQNQGFPFNRPYERPQVQGNQNNNFQDILNEVFDNNNNNNNNNYPSVTEYPGIRPVFNQQWGNAHNQWGGYPLSNNQWSNPNRPGNAWQQRPNQYPMSDNQWSDPSRPGNAWQQRPNQWTTTTTTTPRPTTTKPDQSDKLIFPEDNIESTGSTTPGINVIPMDTTTMSPCELLCPVTPEFNPVCGSDGVTYSNEGRLKCARMCGKDVRLSHHRNCGRSSLSMPLISKNPSQRKPELTFFNFW